MACPSCGHSGTSSYTETCSYSDKVVHITVTKCSGCGTVLNKDVREIPITRQR